MRESAATGAWTVRGAIDRFAGADARAAENAALLARPEFHRLFTARAPLELPARERLARLPVDTLGGAYARFMTRYGFDPGFFPGARPLAAVADAVDYAEHRLHAMHDLLHLLAGYEPSDGDELALQSFVFGQVPAAFAGFMRGCLVDPTLLSDRYKHLRDVTGQTLVAADVRRGAAAGLLIDLEPGPHWEAPLAGLRAHLQVPPRDPASRSLSNTCGLDTRTAFFDPA